MVQVVKVFKSTNNVLPTESTPKSAAKDLRAEVSLINPKFMFDCEIVYVGDIAEIGHPEYTSLIGRDFFIEALKIESGGRCLIPSGLKIELPEGYSMDIRPRSGLALKYGLMLTNSPGLIDEDYRGDVGVIITNTSDDEVIIPTGERIAQMKIVKDIPWTWCEVDSEEELSSTVRGEGGFNSTGTK